jgi:hypothetical protein
VSDIATKPNEAKIGNTNGTSTTIQVPATATEAAPVKGTRGGRRVPDGTKITFFVKDAETMKKLDALALSEHRDRDNMASFLVHKALHTKAEG